MHDWTSDILPSLAQEYMSCILGSEWGGTHNSQYLPSSRGFYLLRKIDSCGKEKKWRQQCKYHRSISFKNMFPTCPKYSLGDEGGTEYGGPRIFQNSTFVTWGLCIIFIVFFKKILLLRGKFRSTNIIN